MSSVIENFIITSDYPTLKNDATATVQAIVSGSQTIAASGTLTGSRDVTLGQAAAMNRGRIASTKNSDIFYVGQGIVFQRTGTVGGGPGPYLLACFMYRTSPTNMRFQVLIQNPYGATLTTEAGDDVITFQANTLITPFT